MIQASQFRPAWWLPGGHAQTIWPFLFQRRAPEISWERLELPDNDFIDLTWCGKTNGPLVIVVHGLEGSVDSHYISSLLAATGLHDWQAVVMHFRGCGREHNRLARGYHSGDTGDFRFLLEQLARRYPGRPLAAIGFSLGGNMLLKYLGEAGQSTPLVAAVAVSVPFELSRAADRMMQGLSRIYQKHLIGKLRQRIRDKYRNRNDAAFDLAKLSQWNNFHLFDNYVTAPLHGFANSAEYYRLCSSRQFLPMIAIPTLLIQAKDDPLIPPDVLPNEKELAEPVTLELSNSGGHVGFIGGDMPWRAERWLEQRIPQYLSSHLSNDL